MEAFIFSSLEHRAVLVVFRCQKNHHQGLGSMCVSSLLSLPTLEAYLVNTVPARPISFFYKTVLLPHVPTNPLNSQEWDDGSLKLYRPEHSAPKPLPLCKSHPSGGGIFVVENVPTERCWCDVKGRAFIDGPPSTLFGLSANGTYTAE